MNKVLVRLYVPILEEEYDIWLPINKKIYKIVEMLEKPISELSGGYYKEFENSMLYDKISGKPYDMNLNAKENNIKNGTEMVLI